MGKQFQALFIGKRREIKILQEENNVITKGNEAWKKAGFNSEIY